MRPSPTTGDAARRIRLVVLAPASISQAFDSAVPSARWPIDLDGLPPGCCQSLLAIGGGPVTGTSARPGSTSIEASLDRTETRSPTVGVLGFPFPFRMLQPPRRLNTT